MTATVSLTGRPLDLVYFIFFMIHLPASFLIDLQALYPSSIVPSVVASLPKFYVTMSNDPLIGNALGYFGKNDAYIWFKSFLVLEAFFQVPVFVLGLRGLWKGSRSIYVLLLVYAASTTTTTLPCLAVILSTPVTSASTVAANVFSITSEQRLLLLSSYIPFFLLPLLMTVDMAFRVLKLVKAGSNAQLAAKRK
ncbi:Transmembrane protein 97 [Grifola frondosa]|uniref:Transmembrane protein 97 n=1 Tax=Grifola frondosa TaxID=5627 RepID=A0A1C7LPW3_GRIFR|nr:Transmembrane protein 97 [Grifola frondosa]